MNYEILNTKGEVINVISAAADFMAAQYKAGEYREQAVAPVDPAPEPRHITVGALYDRFGPAKWGILADTSPLVQAVIKDASVRSYIDLDNPDLPAGLAILQAAGHTIDAESIVNAPIGPGERP